MIVIAQKDIIRMEVEMDNRWLYGDVRFMNFQPINDGQKSYDIKLRVQLS